MMKLLSGTARPDRLNASEPQPANSNGKAPSWLKGRGRRAWGWVSSMLVDARILTVADQHALGLLCDALGEYIECREITRELGRTYSTTTTQGDTMLRPRPEVAQSSDAWRRAARMMIEFGMTPSARSKVKAQSDREVDPFEEFLSGNGAS